MAEIIPALIAHLGQDTAIYAAFGRRIFGNRIPDVPSGTAQPYPYARMREISNTNRYTHNGYGGRATTVQIDVYDDDEAGANANSELLRAALDGWKGQMGAVGVGMMKAHRPNTNWNPEGRNYWRVVEVEILTND